MPALVPIGAAFVGTEMRSNGLGADRGWWRGPTSVVAAEDLACVASALCDAWIISAGGPFV